jgi:hypothetical protein
MTHPGDGIKHAKTFDEALGAYRAGLVFERDARWIRDPKTRERFLTDPASTHRPDVYQDEIDRADAAIGLVREGGDQDEVEARLRGAGLDWFADALQTGRYEDFLVL